MNWIVCNRRHDGRGRSPHRQLLGRRLSACAAYSARGDGAHRTLSRQFEYTYDHIGNRLATGEGGDGSGHNLRTAAWTANELNQLVQRDVPPAVDITGETDAAASPAATVHVNGVPAPPDPDGRFRAEVPVRNQDRAVRLPVTVRAETNGVVRLETGSTVVPKHPETFEYDLDGNLLRDGQFHYTWNAENRLTTVVRHSPPGESLLVSNAYDHIGRRFRKTVTENGQTTVHTFIYNGWNLIQERVEHSDSTRTTNSYEWGLDLSGTFQGASGVGGLLAIHHRSPGDTNTYQVAHDANGNVHHLIDDSGIIAAQYEYDPFGNTIRATGPAAGICKFPFSTKYHDDGTGLVYYGYRFYSPQHGRWLNRDPIAETGGANLYGVIGNQFVGRFDSLGLRIYVFYYRH